MKPTLHLLAIQYVIGLKTHTAHPYGSVPSPFGGSADSNIFEVWTGIEILGS